MSLSTRSIFLAWVATTLTCGLAIGWQSAVCCALSGVAGFLAVRL